MEGFPLITGVRGTRREVRRFRCSLAEQWDIHNAKEGLETVHQLTNRWSGRFETEDAGWDLCRTIQLLAMIYLVRMLKRDQFDQELSRAGQVIQQKFSSWDEMIESYLAGFQRWIAQIGRNVESNLAFRRGIVTRLKSQSFSPYGIPWDTDLSWIPGADTGGRAVVKSLLKNYRGDF